MTRLEERIRTGLQETAERIPDTLPTRAADRVRSPRPTGVWVAVAAVVGVLVLFTPILLLRGTDPDTTPADDATNAFVGTWETTDFSSMMVIEALEGESVEVIVRDFVPVCGAGGSTLTGTGRLQAENQLVFPAPLLTCDDGSQPETLGGSPIEEGLQNLTLTHDPATTAEMVSGQQETDILTDNFGSVWTRESADPTRVTPPSEAEVSELLNGFLAARIAGEGAHEYLGAEEVPLLYATTSGASYERAEFEPVPDIEWPYGFRAFRVRLFAGDTVVEQLFFTPYDEPIQLPADGRLGLEYDRDGFGTNIAPTTEDGQPVALPYNVFDGEVTLHIAHPWIFTDYGDLGGWTFGRLIPEGIVAPTTDGGERSEWDELFLMADPVLVGTDCQRGAGQADLGVLVESIQSYPGVETTAPIAASVGGVEALVMDVKIPAGAATPVVLDEGGDLCANGLLNPVGGWMGYSLDSSGVATGTASGEWVRLFLFDMPASSSVRTMAIAIVAPESSFERAVKAAAPVVDSIEFHAP